MPTVVTGILLDAGRVLLTLRSSTRRAFPGTWALPGGHLEPGEQEVDTLRRELREELGVEVVHHDDEPVARWHLSTGPAGQELRLSAWRVRTWTGHPRNRLPDEHDRIAWFSAGQFDALAWAHPEQRPLLQHLLVGSTTTPTTT